MSFLRKGILNIIGTFAITGINLIVGIILARSLGPKDMGQYQLIFNLITMIVTIGNVGVGQAIIYFVNNRKEDIGKVTTTALFFGLISGFIFSFIALILLQIESYFGSISHITVSIIMIGVLALSIQCSVFPILMAQLKIKYHLFIQIERYGLVLLFILLLLVINGINVSYAIIVQVIGIVLSTITFLWMVKEIILKKISFSFRLLLSMLIYGSQLSLTNIINLINVNIGLFLIRYFMKNDFAYVGHYGRAASIATLMMLLCTSLGPLLYSKWSGLEENQRKVQLEMSTRMMVVFGFFIAVLAITMAKPAILIMYGSEYLPAVGSLRLLVVVALIGFIQHPLQQLFASSGHPLYTSFVMGISLIVMACAMPILIPILGINGAALAVLISNFFSMVVTFSIAVFKYKIKLSHCFIMQKKDLLYLSQVIH